MNLLFAFFNIIFNGFTMSNMKSAWGTKKPTLAMVALGCVCSITAALSASTVHAFYWVL